MKTNTELIKDIFKKGLKETGYTLNVYKINIHLDKKNKIITIRPRSLWSRLLRR